MVVVGGGGLEREATWARHPPNSDVKHLICVVFCCDSCISSSKDFLSLLPSSFSGFTSLLNAASITTIRVGRISFFFV